MRTRKIVQPKEGEMISELSVSIIGLIEIRRRRGRNKSLMRRADFSEHIILRREIERRLSAARARDREQDLVGRLRHEAAARGLERCLEGARKADH